MEQRIPIIDDDDITRIIKRDFPRSELANIKTMLAPYNSDSNIGRNRVYASILKLSEGNSDLLKEYVLKANNDYRDILSAAEYPNYSEHAFEDDLSDEQKKQLIESDWMQYQPWLDKI
jgi:hypothetical protein